MSPSIMLIKISVIVEKCKMRCSKESSLLDNIAEIRRVALE